MFHTKLFPALAAALLSTVLVATPTEAQRNNGVNPWYCQSYDCPSFTPVDLPGGGNAYEIRNYAESQWIATSVDTTSTSASRSDRSAMFRKLFNYISGSNSASQKIEMTVPVLTKIETLGAGQYRLTMMFYLAVPNPPTPTGDGVFLVTRRAGPVFVKSFPSWWWVPESTYGRKATELKNQIGDATLYNDNVYYKAGYNSPYDFFKRKQHEVWVDQV